MPPLEHRPLQLHDAKFLPQLPPVQMDFKALITCQTGASGTAQLNDTEG